MSFDTVRRDIEKRVVDNWATTRVAFDNVEFTPKDGEDWIRVQIFDGTANRINIGRVGVHRHPGLLTLQLFVPGKTGTKVLRGYGDTLSTLFRDVQFNGITCRTPSFSYVGESDGWAQANITVPYYWDGVY